MNLDEATIEVILSSAQGRSTIDLADCGGSNPILYAVKEASRQYKGLNSVVGSVIHTLLKYGCNINCQHGRTGDTPIILACRQASTSKL